MLIVLPLFKCGGASPTLQVPLKQLRWRGGNVRMKLKNILGVIRRDDPLTAVSAHPPHLVAYGHVMGTDCCSETSAPTFGTTVGISAQIISTLDAKTGCQPFCPPLRQDQCPKSP